MHVSSTQDETFTRCERNWWFLYPQRMPSVMKGDLDFGTVIHEVCERYLLADDTGRVPCPEGEYTCLWMEGPLKDQKWGDPVELYPDGWDTIDDKKGRRSLPPVSSILIKKLVEKAIEEGVLERSQGRSIEHVIDRELIPGVNMVGKIDVKLPGEIQDHKSTKDMKWAKSAKRDHWNYLGDSLQMLNYAYESIQEDPSLEEVTLRHNVFCKNPNNPTTRKVTVTVTRAQVIMNWKRLQKQAAKMKAITEAEVEEDDWETIEGPSTEGACQAYGGCPFRKVCSKLESPSQYRKRIELRQSQQKNQHKPHTFADMWDTLEKRHPVTASENDTMGIFEKRLAKRAAQSSPSKQASPQSMQIDGSEASEPVALADTPPNAVVDASLPPWAQADCPACDGRGFNSKGSPCRICDSKSKKAGGCTSADYALDTDDKGNVVWNELQGEESGSAPVEAAAAEVKSQERIELPEEAPAEPVAEDKPKPKRKRRTKKQMEEAKVAEDAAESSEDVSEQPETAAQATGRKKLGYFLYIDCMPIGVETVSIDSIFKEFAADLARSQGKDSYYDLDVFQRREAFARALTAEGLDEKFNKLHILVRNPNGAPDLRAFVDAIVALAPKGRVIQGAA